MLRKTIVVEIEDIIVDSEYFEFIYEVIVDGKSIEKDIYSNDHTWQDDLKGFKSLLEESYAFELALENVNLKHND